MSVVSIDSFGSPHAAGAFSEPGAVRHDWTRAEIRALFALPFPELIFQAQTVHRINFDPTQVQISTLLSIKTGGCPEDCAYCPQSSAYETELKASKLMDVETVLAEAAAAKAAGASRFCMGAAWRSPKDRDLDAVCAMVEGVKAMGMESCVTLGMLTKPQAARLKDAGLDYYNHNLDTSPEFYGDIITTRTYQDRLDTLETVRDQGINVCCGGIVGIGDLAVASGERANQHAGPGRGYAAIRRRRFGPARFRPHHRRSPYHHAGIDGSPVGRPRGHERRDPGFVPVGRRELDLLRP
jgi:biotin synthase